MCAVRVENPIVHSAAGGQNRLLDSAARTSSSLDASGRELHAR
jgi:hypothetical protein